MNKLISVSLFMLAFSLVSGCAHRQKPVTAIDPKVFSWIQSTQSASPMTGKASFWPAKEGVKIRIVVTGATPGQHGMHIHEKGDCGDKGEAAGSHFNPDKVSHGNVLKDGFKKAHPGDLGNILVDSTGIGSLEVFVPGLTLDHERYGIAGRSIIIHEKTDDFSQPTGNAGDRVACVTIPNPEPIIKEDPLKVAPAAVATSEEKPKRKRSPWLLWLH